MSGWARGGVDGLYGGSDNDSLFGDSYTMSIRATGGADKLYGDGGNDSLYGAATP